MSSLFDWLAALPPAAMLSMLAVLALVENVFPPIPADVLVAFGGFLAARSGASPWPTFTAVWLGNIAGAVLMFLLGRRFGTGVIERKFHLSEGSVAEGRMLGWYQRVGVAAFFFSRFVPGVRSIVPPAAGALRVPFPGFLVSIALASAVWYGGITWLAFSTGSNWEALSARVGVAAQWAAIGAGAVLVVGAMIWFLRRRSRVP